MRVGDVTLRSGGWSIFRHDRLWLPPINIAGLGFVAYILLVCVPQVTSHREYNAHSDLQKATSSTSIAGILFLLAGLSVACRNVWTLYSRSKLAFLVISVLLFSNATARRIMSGDDEGAIQEFSALLITSILFFLCLSFWSLPRWYVDSALIWATVSLVAVITIGPLIGGIDERFVGTMEPNHFARYCFVFLVLSSIASGRVSIAVSLASLAGALVVSSRGHICAILMYAVAAHLLSKNGLQSAFASAGRLVLIAFVVTVVIASWPEARDATLNQLAVFDEKRGVNSGFTGRAEAWASIGDMLSDAPFLGYGFRSGRLGPHGVHSGVVSYFLDFGIPLGAILLFVVGGRGVTLVRHGLRMGDRRSVFCGLTVITTLVIQCFEPDHFFIGFPGSFFYMLALGHSPTVGDVAARRPASPRRSLDETALVMRTLPASGLPVVVGPGEES